MTSVVATQCVIRDVCPCIVTDKLIRQSTLDKIWCQKSGALQMLLGILEVNELRFKTCQLFDLH